MTFSAEYLPPCNSARRVLSGGGGALDLRVSLLPTEKASHGTTWVSSMSGSLEIQHSSPHMPSAQISHRRQAFLLFVCLGHGSYCSSSPRIITRSEQSEG